MDIKKQILLQDTVFNLFFNGYFKMESLVYMVILVFHCNCTSLQILPTMWKGPNFPISVLDLVVPTVAILVGVR